MTGVDSPAIVPRPASTVVLMRPGPGGTEVLLTRRPSTMAFGPGLHVFPGGAVDPSDRDAARAAAMGVRAERCAAVWAGDLEPLAALAHAMAALRELYEEAGILLAEHPDGSAPDPSEVEQGHRAGEPLTDLAARLGLRLRADRLVPLSHWVTPPVGVTRRYDTRFFVADAADGVGFRPDAREVAGHAWMRPSEAIEALRAGLIDLWAPTAATLRQVRAAREAADVRSALPVAGPTAAPRVVRLSPGIVRIRAGAGGGLPGRPVCTYLVGRGRLVVVDPGDPNDAAAEAVLGAASAGGGRIAAVAVTSPDPGHAGGAVGLALRAGVPVLAGAGVGPEVSDAVRPLLDGERVELGDVPLQALATPGPDPDHFAFDVPGEGCALVGDLFDSGPPASVPEPPDAAALEWSRRRILDLGGRRRLGAHDA